MKVMNTKSKSIIVFLFVILLTVGAGYQLEAQFYYEESCRGATGIFTLNGGAMYTGGSENSNGWLRLTSYGGGRQTGYVLIPESYPSKLGLTIEFDFKIWGNNEELADGFSVFLYDASVTSFKLGYSGGGLGYLPYGDNSGLASAYLGVLIDEWGNAYDYAEKNPNEGHSHPNVITVAGPAPGYTRISSSSSISPSLAYYNTRARPGDNTYYRRVRIQIDPADPADPISTKRTGMNVSVYLKTSLTGQFTQIIASTNVPNDVPNLLKLGFAGITGSRTANHEVRDMIIKTSGSLSVYKNTGSDDCSARDDDTINITTIVSNGDFLNLNGVAVSDTLPAGFELIDTPLSGGEYAVPPTDTTLSDGRKVYSYTLNINPVEMVRIKYFGTISGTISDTATNYSLSSAVKITPPDKYVDSDTTDNYARVEIPFDYSDAPKSYGLATHFVFDCLKLGTWTAAKKQAQPTMSVEANSDKNDDALTVPVNDPVNLSSSNFKLDNNNNLNVTVAAYNSSDISATLIGWIDFNQNGTFDPDEAAMTTISARSGDFPQTLVWANANLRLHEGISYLRIRITTDGSVGPTSASGFLFNGEVEDYKLNFDILNISKTAESKNYFKEYLAKTGDTVTYSIKVTNKIQGAITVFDPIPPGMEYIPGSASGTGALATENLHGTPISGVKWNLGAKNAGVISELTFSVQVVSETERFDSVYNIAYAMMNGDTISTSKDSVAMIILYRACDNNNAITMNITGNDTAVCQNNALEIIGMYCTENCDFGDSIKYRWEFCHVNSSFWQTLYTPNDGVNCSGSTTEMTKKWLIKSITEADEGYYRMSVGFEEGIWSVVSDSVYVHIIDKFIAPDIRIQICPSPPEQTVRLTSYLDSVNYHNVKWEQVSPYPVITDDETGKITGNFAHNALYTYNYTLTPQYPNCLSTSARVYIHARKDRIFGKQVDTIIVYSALDASKFINLNQVFGLELQGEWSYPDDTCGYVKDNIKTFESTSKYAGAIVFNAQKAYTDAGFDNNIMYKGVLSRKFDFEYAESCVAGARKRITLIVTE
jgi:uncharacterized repeat protein (TIGR01451 family)